LLRQQCFANIGETKHGQHLADLSVMKVKRYHAPLVLDPRATFSGGKVLRFYL
jgi:hypothetical protein